MLRSFELAGALEYFRVTADRVVIQQQRMKSSQYGYNRWKASTFRLVSWRYSGWYSADSVVWEFGLWDCANLLNGPCMNLWTAKLWSCFFSFRFAETAVGWNQCTMNFSVFGGRVDISLSRWWFFTFALPYDNMGEFIHWSKLELQGVSENLNRLDESPLIRLLSHAQRGLHLGGSFFPLPNANSAKSQICMLHEHGEFPQTANISKNSSKTQSPMYREGCMDDELLDNTNGHFESLRKNRQHWEMNGFKNAKKLTCGQKILFKSPNSASEFLKTLPAVLKSGAYLWSKVDLLPRTFRLSSQRPKLVQVIWNTL